MSRRSISRRASNSKSPVRIETLEDRICMSVVFDAQQGVEAVTNGGGNLMGTTKTVQINTIYWGSFWNSTQGTTFFNAIQNSIGQSLY